jgi:hypothetical protein
MSFFFFYIFLRTELVEIREDKGEGKKGFLKWDYRENLKRPVYKLKNVFLFL